MTLTSDVKFKGKLTCGLKNDMRNFMNFHAGSQKSDIFYFDGHLLSKVYRVCAAKKCGGVMCHDTKERAKFGGKMNCGFKIDMKNLVNFNLRTKKP